MARRPDDSAGCGAGERTRWPLERGLEMAVVAAWLQRREQAPQEEPNNRGRAAADAALRRSPDPVLPQPAGPPYPEGSP